MLESVAKGILANALEDVELRRAVALAQHRVCLSLKIRVESFEAILEEQREELSGELEALVPVVILIINLRPVHHRVQYAPNHHRHVRALLSEIVRRHRNVRKHHPREDIARLVHPVAFASAVRHSVRCSHLRAAILQRLLLCEHAVTRALLQRRRQQ